MRRVAILGATSQIATDLVLGWGTRDDLKLSLFSRRPDDVLTRLRSLGLDSNSAAVGRRISSLSYDRFESSPEPYDAIVNFVGVGDPARAASMGSSILDITSRFDDLALAHLDRHPDCRYLFLSSGAAYGSEFAHPADRSTKARIAINDLPTQEFYAVAKLHAEVRHRARPARAIVDIRVFNIFSRTQDMAARFFITDIVRAIRSGETLEVGGDPMVRDFQHPSDFQALVDAVLAAPPANAPIDCFSRAPVATPELLAAMREWFGLNWRMRPAGPAVNATGAKPNYFSVNRRAADDFGYAPRFTSLEGLRLEVAAVLAPSSHLAKEQ